MSVSTPNEILMFLMLISCTQRNLSMSANKLPHNKLFPYLPCLKIICKNSEKFKIRIVLNACQKLHTFSLDV